METAGATTAVATRVVVTESDTADTGVITGIAAQHIPRHWQLCGDGA